MIYRVLFYDRNSSTRIGTGVYAETEQDARIVAAIILGMRFNIVIDPAILIVVEVPSLTSDIPTTT